MKRLLFVLAVPVFCFAQMKADIGAIKPMPFEKLIAIDATLDESAMEKITVCSDAVVEAHNVIEKDTLGNITNVTLVPTHTERLQGRYNLPVQLDETHTYYVSVKDVETGEFLGGFYYTPTVPPVEGKELRGLLKLEVGEMPAFGGK